MKKLILITVIALISGVAISQSITVVNYSGDTLNSGTYTTHGDGIGADTAKLVAYLNTSIGGVTEVTVTRYLINKPDGTKNTFCWDLCYSQDIITDYNPHTSGIVNLTPGQADSSFSAYHYTQGVNADATYRFVWKAKGESDSTYVDVVFEATTDSTTDTTNAISPFKFVDADIQPNPASNQVQISIPAKTGNGYQLEVINVLGKAVYQENMTNTSIINTSELDNGIYFVRISQNNNIVAFEKLIIKK